MSTAARSYLAFLLVLLGAMLMAAIASPWLQSLLAPFSQFPLHRVFSRLMLFGMIGGTAWLVLRRHRNLRELLGFNRSLPLFLQRMLAGLLAGIALMILALAPLALLGVREWNAMVPVDPAAWMALALKALGTGLAVALIEETLFRGAMQGVMQRIGAVRWALFAVPLIYSAVHFLGKGVRVPDEEVNAWSGFVVLQGMFTSFAQPLRILDAFVALYFVGMLLAMVRQRWGDMAGCIGLHAGFVAVIAVFRRISTLAPESSWTFLVGSFDGLLGPWIAMITAVVCLALRTRGIRTAA